MKTHLSIYLSIALIFNLFTSIAQPQHIPSAAYTNDEVCGERLGHSSYTPSEPAGVGFTVNTLGGVEIANGFNYMCQKALPFVDGVESDSVFYIERKENYSGLILNNRFYTMLELTGVESVGLDNQVQIQIKDFHFGVNNGKLYAMIVYFGNTYIVRFDIDNLTFLTEQNAPLNYIQGNSTIKGISVAVVSEILKALESNVILNRSNIQPWARAYQTALQQDNVVLFSIIKTKEREADFQWVGPIHRANVVLFSRKENHQNVSAIEDLSDQVICAIREDVGAQIIKSLGHPEDKTHYPASAEQCAKMLMLGRVDFWAYGADTGHWHLSNAGANTSQYKEALHLHEAFRYIAFSKDVPKHVVSAFQNALDYLHVNGRLQQIIINELQIDTLNEGGNE